MHTPATLGFVHFRLRMHQVLAYMASIFPVFLALFSKERKSMYPMSIDATPTTSCKASVGAIWIRSWPVMAFLAAVRPYVSGKM